MTITQTVDIPADRRVFFDFPKEIPAGKAQIELKIIPFVKNQERREIKNDNNLATPHTDALLDILSGLGEINMEGIRDERLSKHLK